jgi:hypothetical protein
MICRRERDGWLLITQPAHAWLAGELCRIWGNETFARPAPFEAVVLATHLHDNGWLTWDANPRLSVDGRPVSFLETNLEETIPIWRTAVQHVSLLDPYSALLVSKHASTIYRRRKEREIDPPEERSILEEMLDEQETVQNALRAQLAHHPKYASASKKEQSSRAYRWLRLCDLLSLALCADYMPESGSFEAAPGRGPDELININYHIPHPFALRLDPFPLNQPVVQMTIQTRRLGELTYPDQADYLAALESAPWVPQTISVSTG